MAKLVRAALIGAGTLVALFFLFPWLYGAYSKPVVVDRPVAIHFSTALAKPLIIKQDMGGDIETWANVWNHVASSGLDVRLEGVCGSACTLFLGTVPQGRVCMTADAQLGFHLSQRWDGRRMASSREATRELIERFYPAPIKVWIDKRGPLASAFTYMSRDEAVAMGVVRACID